MKKQQRSKPIYKIRPSNKRIYSNKLLRKKIENLIKCLLPSSRKILSFKTLTQIYTQIKIT